MLLDASLIKRQVEGAAGISARAALRFLFLAGSFFLDFNGAAFHSFYKLTE